MERLQMCEEELRKSGWWIRPEALLELVGDGDGDGLSTDVLAAPHGLIAHLLDSDLKAVGRPSLPDPLSLQRTPRLQGPLVLQVVSVRNICQSSSKSFLWTGYEHGVGRLLRIYLTDGFSEISVIEYHSMAAFSVDVAPGTKVMLENTIPMHSGFLLGDARSLKILGGHVPSLYESWEMERKYSGLVRLSTMKSAWTEDDSGPPPFHGLQVSQQRNQSADRKPSAVFQGAIADPVQRVSGQHDKNSQSSRINGSKVVQHHVSRNTDTTVCEQSSVSSHPDSIAYPPESSRDLEDTGTASDKGSNMRKDAIKAALALRAEAAPSHNRAASQKLLEKRVDLNPTSGTGRARGRGGHARAQRGVRQLEKPTLTLDEWEAKKGASSSFVTGTSGDRVTSYDDEALAQKLHYQLNVEADGITGNAVNEAEQIRLSMFSFAGGNNDNSRGQQVKRGRGRGKRRGR